MLIDEGQLERGDGSWRLAGRLDRLDAPPTIRALLSTRLDLLEDDERRVLGPAAVVARSFTERRWQRWSTNRCALALMISWMLWWART
jgi:predicted ATPase